MHYETKIYRVITNIIIELWIDLEPVYFTVFQKKKFLPSYWFVELGTSEDSEWFQINCK